MDETLQPSDCALVSFVKRPLLDALGSQESRACQDVEVFTRRRLTYLQLASNEEAADAVLDEISVDLRREMSPGGLQPLQDLASGVAGDCPEDKVDIHIAIRQLPKYNFASWPLATKK